MSTNDQDNFLKLSIKGFTAMAKDVSKFDKSVREVSCKDAVAHRVREVI